MKPSAVEETALLPPGTVLGRYELIRRLAVGGMAELYVARVTGIEGFEKLVALKRILPQYAESHEFLSMFLDEARLAARLHHPNIAQVYDIGQSDGGLFFTMELVHGQDVRSILRACYQRSVPLPLEHILYMVIGAAAGLHSAHEMKAADDTPLGIVHRDVSPSNILVSFDGCIKLIDFGVAKAARRQSHTKAGTLKGKIAYMSPEQCQGRDIDRRTDVFALGISLWELTTGQRLFKAENEFGTMKKIVYEDVPRPSSLRPNYPLALERIIMRALERNPDDRFATAEALQVELEAFARGENLPLSAVQLARFMRELFGDDAAARQMASAEASEPPKGKAPARARPRLEIVPDADERLPGRRATEVSGEIIGRMREPSLGLPRAESQFSVAIEMPSLLEDFDEPTGEKTVRRQLAAMAASQAPQLAAQSAREPSHTPSAATEMLRPTPAAKRGPRPTADTMQPAGAAAPASTPWELVLTVLTGLLLAIAFTATVAAVYLAAAN